MNKNTTKKYRINDIERENPFDILEHTHLINDKGEFNKDIKLVVDVDKVQDLTLGDFVNDGVDFLIKETRNKEDENVTFASGNYAKIGASGNYAQIGASGDNAQIGASGYNAQIGASGNYAQIGASGDNAQIGASGYNAQIGASGNYAQIGASGNYAQIGASGDNAQIGASGNYAKIGASGNYAQIGASGDNAQIGASGNYAQIGASGYNAQIGASGDNAQIGASGYNAQIGASGNYAQIGASGNYAKIGASGNYAQIGASGDNAQIGASGYNAQIGASGNYAQIGASGNYAQIEVKGNSGIAFACGYKSIIKAKKGTWISLAEYEKNEEDIYIPIFAKSAQIGNEEYTDYKGKILKEKYYYTLVRKEFVPVLVVDGYIMVILSEKKKDNLIFYKTQFLNNFIDNKTDKQFVASNGELFAHGQNLEQAVNDLTFKILQTKDVQDHIKRVCEQSYMMATDYRLITGACWYGTNKWLEENGYTWEDKKTIEEVLELTKGSYGYERLKENFERYENTKKDNQ